MRSPLGMWIYDNAELFRYIGEFPCMREEAARILLSGSVSTCLAPVMRTMYPDAEIVAVDSDGALLAECREEDPALVTVQCPFSSYEGSGFDIAVSALAIERLEARELASYLFSLYDALVKGGSLFLSFPASDRVDVSGRKEVDSWYSMEEKVLMKRYAISDTVKAANVVGFDIRAIEQDINADLGQVVSLHAVKGR